MTTETMPPAHYPRRARPSVLVAIAVGGALGASVRYGISELVRVSPHTFPWATFWINVGGCFLLGVVLTFVLERIASTQYLRPFLATGCLGGFTTYSTFAVETNLLIKDGHLGLAGAYVVASLAAGLTAVWLGIVVARWLPGPTLAVEEVDIVAPASRSSYDEL